MADRREQLCNLNQSKLSMPITIVVVLVVVVPIS